MRHPENRLRRHWRHLRSTSSAARRLFPQAVLDLLTEAVARGEQTHRGEVRVVVEAALPGAAIWAGQSVRSRALDLFAQLGVWDTADNCGVLLYLNLADRKVEIVADRGINAHVTAAEWQGVCAGLTAGLAAGHYGPATVAAVEAINALLRRDFPSNGKSGANELPDAPLLI